MTITTPTRTGNGARRASGTAAGDASGTRVGVAAGTAAEAGADTSTGPAGVDRLQATRLASQIQFLTARARSRGTGHANALLKEELDLKVSHFSVLSVAAHGTNPTQRELSEFLDLDPSQVVTLVDVLEQRGLVERLTDPKDRRSRMIAVTEEGHRVEQRGYELTEASDEEVLANLSLAEREQLRGLLTRIAF